MGVEKCLFLLYCECMGNNRTTLESKGRHLPQVRQYHLVIIEPHWNLKWLEKDKIYSMGIVIIEPHWNLKANMAENFHQCNSSNNRTTLESKAKTLNGKKVKAKL